VKGTGFLSRELLVSQGVEEEGRSINAVAALPGLKAKTQKGGFEASAKPFETTSEKRNRFDEAPSLISDPVLLRGPLCRGEKLFSVLLNGVRKAREKLVRSNTPSTPVGVFKSTLKSMSGVRVGEVSLGPPGRP